MPSFPPTLGPHAGVGPMSGSGTLCADPAGSARAPRPKVRFGSPTPPTRTARVRASPQPAGAPPPPPRRLLSLPSPREGGGDSAALPRPSRRRPQQAPCPLRPSAAGRTSGARGSPAEVSGAANAGDRKPRRPGNSLQAANFPREGRGYKTHVVREMPLFPLLLGIYVLVYIISIIVCMQSLSWELWS